MQGSCSSPVLNRGAGVMLTLACMQQDTTAHMTVLVGDLSYADSANKATSGHNCTQV